MSTVQDFVRPELNKGGDQLRGIRPMPNRQFDTTSTFTMPKPRRKPLKRLTRHGRAKVYRLKGYTSVAGVRAFIIVKLNLSQNKTSHSLVGFIGAYSSTIDLESISLVR